VSIYYVDPLAGTNDNDVNRPSGAQVSEPSEEGPPSLDQSRCSAAVSKSTRWTNTSPLSPSPVPLDVAIVRPSGDTAACAVHSFGIA
jgi:hypothetical protein